MKKLLLAFLVLSITAANLVHAAQGEPDGFRGIKWGAEDKAPLDLSPLQGQKGSESFYEMKGELLQVGKAEIESIKYGFYKNKFYKGIIEFKSAESFKKLKEKLEEEYGTGKQPFAGTEKYLWDWPNVGISLEYKAKTDTGSITYYYKPLQKEKLVDKKLEEKIKRMKSHMD